jgi:uncharacterized DUF497 family protein
MRFKFDKKKSQMLRNDPRRKIGFEEARELFDSVFFEDQHIAFPHQWRATGWVRGELYTIVYEARSDKDGEYYHLVTLWKSTMKERLTYEEKI